MASAEEIRKDIQNQYDRILKPLSGEITREEVMIPVEENISLRTVIFRNPKAEKPLPTVVIRSCYPSQQEKAEIQLEELAARGFAGVLQWCRGKNGSEGKWEPYFNERNDGRKLMEWLQNQPWVKNIGLTGGSYLALVGWEIGDVLPEKVKTMYLTVLGTEWHTSLWADGAFRQDVYTAWLMSETAADCSADYEQTVRFRPQVEVDETLWHKRSQVYRDFITHPSPADPYWNEGFWGQLRQVPEKMNIPVYIGEGWYDIHLQNMLDTYVSLSDESKKHSWVQVNPGNHPRVPVIPGQKRQINARIDDLTQQIRWFKSILMDEHLPDPSVDFYLIGADEWISFADYPVKPDEECSLYLDGCSLKREPGNDSVREYDYDPDDPVPSHGSGTLFRTSSGVGSLQQPECNYRQDVLSYMSQPLDADMDIIGKIRADLYVQSDAPDTCFTFKLMEVREDGTAWNIRDGITTLGYRNGASERQSYDGKPVRIEFEGWEIAWRVRKGSRVRVDISSSNFPEYSVHPNTETDWARETCPVVAHQKILAGGSHPSRIVLPLKHLG